MNKHRIVVYLISVVLIVLGTRSAKAAELITNGGFETGTFAGWTVSPIGNQGWYPWQVTAAGSGDTTGNIQVSAPLFGTRDAWNGFCCNTTVNPEYVYQDITLPAAQTASITWSDKIQSNLTQFCTVPNCGSNTYRVEILDPSNNALLVPLYMVVAAGGTNVNTGWITHGINISTLAGRTIRIRFSTFYTGQQFNGPGRAEIDGVSVQTPSIVAAPTAAEVSIAGQVRTFEGIPISRAFVTATDSAGNSRIALTNPFGYFQLNGIEAGGTYVISVTNKKYLFPDSPRIIQIQDNIVGLDFLAAR